MKSSDIFKEYVSSYELYTVKTIQMGSIYELKYEVNIKDIKKEKEMV